jgi:hypothetical protein
MRFFQRKESETITRLQHERDCALESASRFAEANLKLTERIMQLSEKVSPPPQPDGEVDQPVSTREADRQRVILEDPERRIRPEPPKLGRR